MATESFSASSSSGSNKNPLSLGPTGVNDANKIIDPRGSDSYEEDLDLSTVDGTNSGPRSMSMFGYNRFSPECCPNEYTGNGGCVCETEAQRKFRSSRGMNNMIGDDRDI